MKFSKLHVKSYLSKMNQLCESPTNPCESPSFTGSPTLGAPRWTSGCSPPWSGAPPPPVAPWTAPVAARRSSRRRKRRRAKPWKRWKRHQDQAAMEELGALANLDQLPSGNDENSCGKWMKMAYFVDIAVDNGDLPWLR